MGKFRNECLSLEWFRNRTEAWIGIEHWRRMGFGGRVVELMKGGT